MDPIIRVEQLSKRYRIRHQTLRSYLSLRDELMDSFRGLPGRARNLFRRGTSSSNPAVEDFWALKNVSFTVQRGDVLGIVGRNGAGKSTLLKILSRITEPTGGRVELNGRVASLLEVGTGFHPELSGRENVFLNGAILGMSREEIKRKFDEIVAFADVEKFLDTPVKRYSSGMYVRLAFSVAAHLEPEIFVVDEVLSVGDAEFQKKCLGKMQEVSRGGRTVLFVSHNMGAVQELCNSALYLESGSVKEIGSVESIISKYSADVQTRLGLRAQGMVPVNDSVAIRGFELTPNQIESGEAVQFRIEVASREAARLSELALILNTQQGYRVGVLDFRSSGLPVTLHPDQPWELRGEIKGLPLVEGDYSASLYLNVGDFIGEIGDLAGLHVSPRMSGSGHAPYPAVHRGVVVLEFRITGA